MSIQVADILQRLQSALDQNYNVADMETVLQVITTLEDIQITKEQLETTRLGKHINLLRRRTNNESLARRAKNLLKKWREMVLPLTNPQQQTPPPPQQPNATHNLSPMIPKDSPGMQYDGRGVPQPYYNQVKESASFHEASDRIGFANANYPTSDRRSGRVHEAGPNHAPLSSKHPGIVAEQPEDCARYNKYHDNKSNLNANIGRKPTSSSYSSKNKDFDPYRTLSAITDNSKSHISISALPKIPKIKNSATSVRISKHADQSHSPLASYKESSKLSSSVHDDDSAHAFDMQHYKQRFPSNQPTFMNGRNQDYAEQSDNNIKLSSANIIESQTIAPNQVSSEFANSEVVKKKHKKHKKDKKSKKQKQSPVNTDRVPVSGPPILELPDSLSANSNSMGLFHLFANDFPKESTKYAYATTIEKSLPSTSISKAQNARNPPWPPVSKTNAMSLSDLTFSGKFTNTDDNIISIDSSSASNSPKYRSRSPMLLPQISRSSSPSRMHSLPIRGFDYGSRVATDEESSIQNISMLQQTESSMASAYGESLAQDDSFVTEPIKTSIRLPVSEPVHTAKKRGRKKGSKGVDSRLGSASNSSQSQQGAPFHDSFTLSSLKTKIESIRGTTKKVKTTAELLEDIRSRKATTSGEDGIVAEVQPTYPDGDENSVTNGKFNTGSRPASPQPASVGRGSERGSSKKSKSAAKEASLSDNQSSYENQAVIESTEPKSVIDKEIEELRAQLPPIDKTVLAAWRKCHVNNAAVCTCKLIELENTPEVDGGSITMDPMLENVNVPKMLTDCNVLPTAAPIDMKPGPSDDQSHFSKSIPQPNSTVATSTIKAIAKPTNEPPQMAPPAKRPTVRSIFDLDYEDDDPITFKLNHNNNINLNLNTKFNKLSSDRNSNNDISDDKSCDELFLNENTKQDGVEAGPAANECAPLKSTAQPTLLTIDSGRSDDENGDGDDMQAVDAASTSASNTAANVVPSNDESVAQIAPIDLNPTQPQSRFRIEEDPDCKAKQLYITSKQSITTFHIDNLHTAYIPNINGNWDHVKCESAVPDDDTKSTSVVHNDQEQMTDIETSTKNRQTDDADDASEVMEDIELEPRITEASIGLYDRVVPLCNHLHMDNLPKSLSHINIQFNPSDEVEPEVFIASIMADRKVIEPQTNEVPLPLDEHQDSNDVETIESKDDESFGTTIDREFSIYGCSNDLDYSRCDRKRSPDIGLSNLNRGSEVIESVETSFECAPPIQELSDMEADDADNEQLNTVEGNNDCRNSNKLLDNAIELKSDGCGSENEEPFSRNTISSVIIENAAVDDEKLDSDSDSADDEQATDSDDTSDDNSTISTYKPFDYSLIENAQRKHAEEIKRRASGRNDICDRFVESFHGRARDCDVFDNNAENLDCIKVEKFGTVAHFSEDGNGVDVMVNTPILDGSDDEYQHGSESNGSSHEDGSSRDERSGDESRTSIAKISNNLDGGHSRRNNNNITKGRNRRRVSRRSSSSSQSTNNDNDIYHTNDHLRIRHHSPENVVNVGPEDVFRVERDNYEQNSDSESKFSVPTYSLEAMCDMTFEEPNESLDLNKFNSAHSTDDERQGLFSPFSTRKRKRRRSRSTRSSNSSSSSSSLSPVSKRRRHWNRSPELCPQHGPMRMRTPSSESSECPESPLVLGTDPEAPDSTSEPEISDADFDQRPFKNGKSHVDQKLVANYDEHLNYVGLNQSEDASPSRNAPMNPYESPPRTLLFNKYVNNNATLLPIHANHLEFELPEKLLQSDDKDGDDDSDDLFGYHRNGISTNQDLHTENPMLSDAEPANSQEQINETSEHESSQTCENNGMLPSFNDLGVENRSGVSKNENKFKEWYEVVHVKSYNDELLTILPYVVID